MDVFLGLPFAAPPLGDLRFANPKYPEPWGDVYDATEYKPVCTQDSSLLPIDEDCLYLNVFAPYVRFLSTGDEVAPGNWGLLDNVIALEWVRDNIASFGGDPTRVTVFGHSAGGVMASMHMYSPLSSGLIAGSLPQSGNAMTPWALYRSPDDPTDVTRQLAEQMNCSTASSSEIVDCLRTKPWQDIVDQSVNAPERYYCSWTPVVDGYFLLDDPRNSLEKGEFVKVPLMVGTVKDERSSSTGSSPTMTREEFDSTIQDFVEPRWAYTGNQDEITDALIYEYCDPTDVDNEFILRNEWTQLDTDYVYVAAAELEATGHSSMEENTYYYSWHYRSELHPQPIWTGVQHIYELYLEFGVPYYGLGRECPWNCYYSDRLWTYQEDWTDKDREISDLFITLISNLAKYGNPTPSPVHGLTWEPFDDVNEAYLQINDVSVVDYHYRAREMLFWQDYFQNVAYRQSPAV
ncbi:neuroligin-4, Y-linked-like [Glandiceps talaboti]